MPGSQESGRAYGYPPPDMIPVLWQPHADCPAETRRLGDDLLLRGWVTTDSRPGLADPTGGLAAPNGGRVPGATLRPPHRLRSSIDSSIEAPCMTLTGDAAGLGLYWKYGKKADHLRLRLSFTEGSFGYRLRQWLSGQVREELLHALRRLPAGSTVLDASTGTGQDSLLLAARGFRVIACERHPILAALLQDACWRASRDPALTPLLARWQLQAMDACAYLDQHPMRFAAAIFDPMFPERYKTAAVRQEMRILHQLLGADSDADAPAVLQRLQRHVQHLVLVKRPRLAPPLGELPPHHSSPGRAVRFDHYPGIPDNAPDPG